MVALVASVALADAETTTFWTIILGTLVVVVLVLVLVALLLVASLPSAEGAASFRPDVSVSANPLSARDDRGVAIFFVGAAAALPVVSFHFPLKETKEPFLTPLQRAAVTYGLKSVKSVINVVL